MKFFNIVLVLVLAFATIVASSITAEYGCNTDTTFTFSSNDTPSISKKAQEFLGSIMVDMFNEAYAKEVVCKDNANRKQWRGHARGDRCDPLCDNADDSCILTSSEVPVGVRMLWRYTGDNAYGPLCDNDDESRILSSVKSPKIAGDARKLWLGWSSNGSCHICRFVPSYII